MQIIPGYWDPRNLQFIEYAELDQLEMCSAESAGTKAGAAPAPRTSGVSGATASGPGSAGASGKSKIC